MVLKDSLWHPIVCVFMLLLLKIALIFLTSHKDAVKNWLGANYQVWRSIWFFFVRIYSLSSHIIIVKMFVFRDHILNLKCIIIAMISEPYIKKNHCIGRWQFLTSHANSIHFISCTFCDSFRASADDLITKQIIMPCL